MTNLKHERKYLLVGTIIPIDGEKLLFTIRITTDITQLERKRCGTMIILQYNYEGEENGLPLDSQLESIHEAERKLSNILPNQSVVAYTRTGGDQVMWVIYVKNKDKYITELIKIFEHDEIIGFDVNTGKDPRWINYDHILDQVKKSDVNDRINQIKKSMND